jgi:ABC-2 type transport system permease protein
MRTKIHELTKIFLKNSLDYKSLFILTLIFPLIFLIWNNYSLLFKDISDDVFYNLLFNYLSFITIMYIMSGFSISLLAYKENGFLKMFKYVIGSKNVIIISNFIAQSITLFLTLLVFTIVACIMFMKFSLLFQTVLVVILSLLVCLIPISMFFLWIPALNVRLATISPITSLIAIALTFLNSLSTGNNNISEFLFLLNPVKLFTETLDSIYNLVFQGIFDPLYSVTIVVILLIYTMFGLSFTKKIEVLSSLSRF